MNLLHLSSEKGLRGGENQLLLLAGRTRPGISEWYGLPPGSGLSTALPADIATLPIRCRGLLDLASIATIRSLARSKDIDLIHAHSNRAHKTAAAAKIGRRQRLIVSRRNAFRCRGGWAYRAADHFITISEAGYQALRAGGITADRISIIHDAVDEPALAAASPERCGLGAEEIMILCVAAFTAEKDHATLLDAWHLVQKASPRAHLILAGDGPDLARIRARAEGLPRVTFLGWRNDVASLTKGADIVTLASREEGLGSSLCTAQLAGKPVVATAAGGIAEAVSDRETGLLSPPGDAEQLAQNLIAMSEDSAMRRAYGEAGAERARGMFSLDTFHARHLEIYRRLTGA
ncbi:glycosyltransferase involved in cell wall bisynthesis [Hoeflea halophila]|uniref:Glycosyltransferase involved in cell wall bisynthesis n=1 Tax=Hoeflea halophila TaxID=714899 RepID=A0A286I2S7_9HYPH|nr:glycosyltransferase family 4 protein [Hoeflea halophila]SOE13654.1 glycosyltransferase involved in cell wall bisynthesis [Hoeflea halophila]